MQESNGRIALHRHELRTLMVVGRRAEKRNDRLGAVFIEPRGRAWTTDGHRVVEITTDTFEVKRKRKRVCDKGVDVSALRRVMKVMGPKDMAVIRLGSVARIDIVSAESLGTVFDATPTISLEVEVTKRVSPDLDLVMCAAARPKGEFSGPTVDPALLDVLPTIKAQNRMLWIEATDDMTRLYLAAIGDECVVRVVIMPVRSGQPMPRISP